MSGESEGPRWTVRYEPSGARAWLAVVLAAVLGGLVALAVAPQVRPDAAGRPELRTPTVPPPIPPGDLEGTSATIVQVVERVGPSVVAVINRQYAVDMVTGQRMLVDEGLGSGVVFDERGHIVTNAHVVAGHDALDVVLADGKRVPARLVATDAPYSDIAVIQVDPSGLQLVPARFGDSSRVRVGEIVLAIGNPRGLEFFRSVTMGVVSGIRSDLLQKLAEQGGPYPEVPRVLTLIQTDAAINRGNSGGPLVNLRGEVIGINTLKFGGEDVEGMGFAIPSNDVRAIATDLIRQGYVSRPALGIRFFREDVARSEFGVGRGLLVHSVEPGGPAARAGVRPGDVVLRLDGVEIDSFLTLLKELSRRRVGDRVRLTLLRDGRQLEVQVVLGELGRPGRP